MTACNSFLLLHDSGGYFLKPENKDKIKIEEITIRSFLLIPPTSSEYLEI